MASAARESRDNGALVREPDAGFLRIRLSMTLQRQSGHGLGPGCTFHDCLRWRQSVSSGRVAGPSRTEPSGENREPWQLQSQVVSALFR